MQQMQNKNQIKIKVYLKEILMHSALMWYLCQNFEELYAKDIKLRETIRKNLCPRYGYNGIACTAESLKDYDLFGLRFYTVYQLLSSNYLKVESENLSLGFIFHYTRLQDQCSAATTKTCILFMTDVLSTVLRY
jgi:hypothetical protein